MLSRRSHILFTLAALFSFALCLVLARLWLRGIASQDTLTLYQGPPNVALHSWNGSIGFWWEYPRSLPISVLVAPATRPIRSLSIPVYSRNVVLSLPGWLAVLLTAAWPAAWVVLYLHRRSTATRQRSLTRTGFPILPPASPPEP